MGEKGVLVALELKIAHFLILGWVGGVGKVRIQSGKFALKQLRCISGPDPCS